MGETIKINCPSCGSVAPHSQSDKDFTCEYCGTYFRIKQSGDDLQLIPFIESIQELKSGVDRTGSEMTIKRLKEDIVVLNSQLAPLDPEFERLKSVVNNPGMAIKYKKYWWIGIPAALILFGLGVAIDKIGLAILALVFFFTPILMYTLAAQKAIQIKLITRRFEELSKRVIPLREAIKRKKQLLQRHLQSIDQ